MKENHAGLEWHESEKMMIKGLFGVNCPFKYIFKKP